MLEIEFLNSSVIQINRKCKSYLISLVILLKENLLITKPLYFGDISRKAYEKLYSPEIHKVVDGYIVISSAANVKIKIEGQHIVDYRVLSESEVKEFKRSLPKKSHSYVNAKILSSVNYSWLIITIDRRIILIRYNANEVEYEKIEILGKEGLFIDLRIDFDTVPRGLFCYELRHDDDGKGDPVTLENKVFVNFYGTVILKEAIDFNKDDFIDIEYSINYLCEYITLSDFIS